MINVNGLANSFQWSKILCLLLLLFLGSHPLNGLSIREGALNNKRLFAFQFANGTSYYGRHDRINSASLQYYQSGPYIVTEMVVDIASSDVLLRIYHTELINTSDLQNRVASGVPGSQAQVPEAVQQLIDRGREGADQARSGQMVVKDYPASTHAKTLEYRVSEKSELEALYQRFIDILTLESTSGEDDTNAERISMAGTIFVIN